MTTSDTVNEFLNNIHDSMNKWKYFGVDFLDLSKAFDTIPHKILILKI